MRKTAILSPIGMRVEISTENPTLNWLFKKGYTLFL